ncbi:MAG: hypothetical protein HZA08_07390 [Nitrospirae bacterium]|nr:hypothetical protein [Nitrospirota bacterium]
MNLLFYCLGFVTAFLCFGCASLIMAADRADREREEDYERWRREYFADTMLEEIERREVM